MGKAKDIILRPIDSKEANALIKRVHYSGKVVQNSQIHIGVYYRGKLEGALQFGPSLDKRKLIGLVKGTLWNEFIELNRLAFSDELPRNSESRAISVAMRMLRKYAPHLKWVVSFADATQCGDGTIYRASGFVLTGIRRNNETYKVGDTVIHTMTVKSSKAPLAMGGTMSTNRIRDILGWETMDGYQLRYIYFLEPSYRQRLTVPEIPFSRIAEMGAGMYKGVKRADAV